LGRFVVFGGDYEDLSARQASGTFTSVFVMKGDQGIAFGAVEPNSHV
jgi:hypothetical protein